MVTESFDINSKAVVSYDNAVLVDSGGTGGVGDIVVNDSANIHIGTKNVYNGSVTIKQYAGPSVLDNKEDLNVTNCVVIDRVGKEVVPTSQNKNKWHTLSRKLLIVTLICFGLVGVASTILLLEKTKTSVDKDTPFVPPENVFEDDTDYSNQTIFSGLKVVTRKEWDAAPPTGPYETQTLPLKKVIIGHTVTTFCKTITTCSIVVKSIQLLQRDYFGDIGYNFLVGGDGNAYFGVGWNTVGAHTYGFNRRSLGVALIGDFTKRPATESQINATLLLIAAGVKLGKIDPDYVVYGQCQLMATLSPGQVLYQQMRTWPHFDNDTECTFQ